MYILKGFLAHQQNLQTVLELFQLMLYSDRAVLEEGKGGGMEGLPMLQTSMKEGRMTNGEL